MRAIRSGSGSAIDSAAGSAAGSVAEGPAVCDSADPAA